MKLYYVPGLCSLAPHIMLHELGKEFEIEKVDLGAKLTASGKDYYTINAKGYVPALEIETEFVLTEVSTVLQYLADTSKSTELLPEFGTIERYRVMETLNFIASELHKNFGMLFNRAMPDEGKEIIRLRIAKRLDYVDALLAQQDFMTGKSFGVADVYAFAVIRWCKQFNIDLAKWENVSRFMTVVGYRPAVLAAMKAEGLLG